MIDFTKTKQYTLSIRLSTDGFSFSIYNPLSEDSQSIVDKEVNATMSLTANLKEIFLATDFLSYPYKKVNVMIVGKRYTTIPLELFDENQTEVIFYQNHAKINNEKVMYNILRGNNLAILFGIDKSIYSYIIEQFPDATFYSQSTPLIDYFTQRSRQGNSRKMYVSIRESAIDIFCFEHGNLILVNTFECNNTKDRIYYLLYAWKQLEFDQERDEMHLTGELSDKENMMSELRTFIKQAFIMNPANNIDMQALLTCE